MANKLVLKIDVDDKGNPVLADMSKKALKAQSSVSKLGKTLNTVFVSAVMLKALNDMKTAIAGLNNEILQFEKTFKQVSGITKTVGSDLERLKDITIQLSNATEHSSTAIAKAVLNISKMGFSVEQSIKAMPALLDLATASMVDISEASRVAVQAMKSFELGAEDISHITNVMHGSISQSAQDFENYSEALKFVAPIATKMGISIEEVSSMLANLADSGIKASLAGNTLKNMFLNIMTPSEAVAKVISDNNNDFESFTDLLGKLDKAGVPVNEFLDTFNKRAIAGAVNLSKSSKEVAEFTEKLRLNAFSVEEAANVIRGSWTDQLDQLGNIFTNVFQEMGRVIEETDLGNGLQILADELINIQNIIKNNPEVFQQFAKDLATIAGAVGITLVSALEIVVKHFDDFVRILKVVMGFNLAKSIWAGAAAMKSFGIATGVAKVQATQFGLAMKAAIPHITAAYIAAETLAWWFEKSAEHTDKIVENSTKMEKMAIEKRIKALEDWADKLRELEALQKLIADPQARAELNEVGQLNEILNKLEEKKKLIDDERKSITKQYDLHKAYLGNLSKEEQVLKMIKGEQINLSKLTTAPGKEGAKEGKKTTSFSVTIDPDDLKKKAKDATDFFGLAIGDRWAELFDKGYEEGVVDMMTSPFVRASSEIQNILASITAVDLTKAPQGLPISPGAMPSIGGSPAPSLGGGQSGGQQTGLNIMPDVNTSIAAFDEVTAKAMESAAKISEDFKEKNMEIDGFLYESAASYAQAIQDKWMSQADAMFQGMQMMMDIMQQFADRAEEKMKQRHKKEKDRLTNRKNHALAMAKDNVFKQKLLMASFAEEEKKLKDKQEREEKDRRKKQKAMDIVSATINTMVGITKVFASMGPPASFVLAALTAAAGAVQIGMIASQNYAMGGLVKGQGGPTTDSVPASLSVGEYVVPAQTVNDLGGSSGINQIIDERVNSVSPQGPSIVLQIDTLIGTPEYERELFGRLEQERANWVQI